MKSGFELAGWFIALLAAASLGVVVGRFMKSEPDPSPRVTAICEMSAFGTWVVTVRDEAGRTGTAEENLIDLAFSEAISLID
jgi:hypothetical protein